MWTRLALISAVIMGVMLIIASGRKGFPVSGLILEKNVRPGDLSAGGATPWFRMARDGQVELSADLSGHTYFGCCAGCNKHLTENAAARQAKDPVTGNVVDKASAVIGARPDGSVVYFESAETFARGGGA